MNLPVFAFAGRNETDSLGTISGTVFTSDGQSAAYVTVLIKNTTKGTITDTDGKFYFKKLKTGNYILSVSLSGYTPTEIAVEVKQNEIVSLKIQLQVTYKELLEVTVKSTSGLKYVETKTSESMRLNLPLNEVPQNIVVVTRKLMEDQGVLSVTEAFRAVSGAQKTYGGLNDYSMMMRGTEVPYWASFRNGIGGYFWNQQDDVDMLEKIEFVKGPADFMVGASTGGGVINNVTKQPVKESIAGIRAGFGSYDLMRLTTDFGGPLSKNGKISYRFNAGIHNQGRAFEFGKAVRYFICPVVKYDITTRTSITAEYNYMWGKTSGNNDYLPSINGEMFALPRNFAVADDKTDQLVVADNYYRLHLKHNFNGDWHLNLQLAYVNGKWGGHFMNSNGGFPVINDTLYRFASYDDWRNFSKVALGFIDGKFYTGKKIEHKVLFGPEYNHLGVKDQYGSVGEDEPKFGLYLPRPDHYVHPDSLNNFPLEDPSNLDVKAIPFYAQDNIKIAGKLIVTLAGRYTHVRITIENYGLPDYLNDTKYDVFTPRGGLTWLFTSDISAYALYDQFFQTQQARNIENKPFKPLTGFLLETGIKSFFFGKKLGMNLSAYHLVKNNVITADTANPSYYIQRDGQIVSDGMDFDLTGNLTPAFIVNANYAYTDAKITKNSDPSLVGLQNYGTAHHSGNLWLKYRLLQGKLKGISFAAGYQYMGKRIAVGYYNPDPATRFLPPYNLFDASISWGNEKFNVGLNVYNITNINYVSLGYFSRRLNEWRYTPGEPINFRLSFGVNLRRNKKDH